MTLEYVGNPKQFTGDTPCKCLRKDDPKASWNRISPVTGKTSTAFKVVE